MENGNVEEKRTEAALEAILFAMGDAVELEKLADAVGQSTEKTREILERMTEQYQDEARGIRLIELEGSFQLCTKSELYDCLIRIAKQPRKIVLTDIMLETLSIIAYKQPITKLEIEKIRGVKSDHAVNRLVEYNLVRELGRLDAPGRPLLFGTTEEFLRHFGIQSLADLPSLNPVQMEDFKAEAEEEVEMQLKV
jgi:segregation and condensation protein B